jgi:hypothetical protein
MSDGGDTPALVCAVSRYGALGSIGATSHSQHRSRRQHTLFGPAHRDLSASTLRTSAAAGDSAGAEPRGGAPYYAELGLPPPEPPTVQRLRSTNRLLLRSRAARPSSASRFALLPPEAIAVVKTRGMFVMSRFERTLQAITPC